MPNAQFASYVIYLTLFTDVKIKSDFRLSFVRCKSPEPHSACLFVSSREVCAVCVSCSSLCPPSTASHGSACLWKSPSVVIIIANKMLHPLHIITPPMLITVLVINDSLNNYGQRQ